MKFSILWIVGLVLASSLTVQGRDSRYTREGRAPLYWMAYEQCFTEDRALDETRWRRNIDWVAENLLQYGYDMVCTDGWIEGAQTVDGNGYITRYNSGWGQDFGFYVKLARRKGLRSGVYYNPLWMTRAAWEADTPVKGTSYTARQISGDKKFNDMIHWVDTDRPGSEQWVKGYVRHFIDLGFEFLRVDFLNWYENDYGSIRYRRALRWIMEEAGDEIMVSLVMPNCWDHAANERKYGDMFRISEDVFGGGFDFVSGRRRGIRQDGWANWGNLYDGFLDFSDIPRDEIIMDGDFVRLNTVERDCEKEFWITLLTMAGSPIAAADQYDTAGDNLRFYQNVSLLALQKEGFHGKPLCRDASDPDSNVWTGITSDGDVVVAVFNREENAIVRNITPSALGAAGKRYCTDLWSGVESEPGDEDLRVRLGAHSVKVYRFSDRRDASVEEMPEAARTEEIYTLDGRRIAGGVPDASGVYLIRRGTQTEKRIIR